MPRHCLRSAKAGSAVNDTVQELGGNLGVAVIGSLVATAYRSQFTAGATAARGGALGDTVAALARPAFTTAMTHGFTPAAAVAGRRCRRHRPCPAPAPPHQYPGG